MRAARPHACAGPAAALLLRQYGYLLNCHGRITIRRAIEQYQRSIDLGPGGEQAHYQWIGAKATLGEAGDAVTRYQKRAAASHGDLRELRFLAHAHLAAKDFGAAKSVIDAGLAAAPDDGPDLRPGRGQRPRGRPGRRARQPRPAATDHDGRPPNCQSCTSTPAYRSGARMARAAPGSGARTSAAVPSRVAALSDSKGP